MWVRIDATIADQTSSLILAKLDTGGFNLAVGTDSAEAGTSADRQSPSGFAQELRGQALLRGALEGIEHAGAARTADHRALDADNVQLLLSRNDAVEQLLVIGRARIGK